MTSIKGARQTAHAQKPPPVQTKRSEWKLPLTTGRRLCRESEVEIEVI